MWHSILVPLSDKPDKNRVVSAVYPCIRNHLSQPNIAGAVASSGKHKRATICAGAAEDLRLRGFNPEDTNTKNPEA